MRSLVFEAWRALSSARSGLPGAYDFMGSLLAVGTRRAALSGRVAASIVAHVDLIPREAERLLDEDRLAGPQRGGCDLGVCVVTGTDENEIDIRRLDRLTPVAAGAGAVERAGQRRG